MLCHQTPLCLELPGQTTSLFSEAVLWLSQDGYQKRISEKTPEKIGLWVLVKIIQDGLPVSIMYVCAHVAQHHATHSSMHAQAAVGFCLVSTKHCLSWNTHHCYSIAVWLAALTKTACCTAVHHTFIYALSSCCWRLPTQNLALIQLELPPLISIRCLAFVTGSNRRHTATLCLSVHQASLHERWLL